MIKTENRLASILLIFINLYFLYATAVIIYQEGGPMGFGLMVLPITFSIHLFLIPSILAFKKKFSESRVLFVILFIGLFWASYWLWKFFRIP